MAQDGDMEAGVRSLLEVNNLGFRMTPGMSVATSRVTREWDALRPEYTEGDILTFAISSGAAYVDPDNSYITFDLDITTLAGGITYMFFWGNDTQGRQNALNLFQEMRYTHSSGYEVDRVTKGFAPWNYIKNAYTKDEEWHNTFGSLMRGVQTSQVGTLQWGNDGGGGAWPQAYPEFAPVLAASVGNGQSTPEEMYYGGDTTVIGGHNFMTPTMRPFHAPAAPTTIRVRVAIPLSCLSGVWDTDQLSPSFLMAGSRLELTLQSKQQVFQVRSTGAAVIVPGNYSYVVRNPKMVLETITFTDAVLRSISMTSANVGLEIPFVAMHYTNAPLANSETSIQVNRGLSRANMIVARVYPNRAQDNSPRCCGLDSVASYFIAPNTQGWQVKLGAEFMPSAPLKQPLGLYHAAQVAFGNWKADRRNTVRMVDYQGAGKFNQDFAGPDFHFRFCPYSTLGCYAMTLEKSSTLAQSGSPISAARDLNVVFGGDGFTKYGDVEAWNGLSCDIFVPYITLATVFLDSVLTRS